MVCANLMKNKNSETITEEISSILTKLSRSPLRIESARGAETYKSVFQNFLKTKNIHHYSLFTDKRPSIAEKVSRTIRIFLQKPICPAGNAYWISELPSVIKQYNITIHQSIKMTEAQAIKKANEKEVYTNVQERRDRQQRKFKLGQLVKTADIKRVFSKGGATNCSYILNKVTEVIHDTIPSYPIS